MFPVVVLAILLAAVIFLALIPAEHWERMSALMDPDKDITIYRRLSYHIIGFDLVSQFPVFGAGFGNFPLFFDDLDYRWLTGRVPDEDGFKQLHNQYLQVAAESGVVAFAAYIALLASCFMGLGRVCRRAASPAVGLLAEAVQFSFASLLIQIAFLSNKLNKYLWIYIGLAIALHYVNKAEARRLEAAGVDEPAVSGPRSASG
jgi:O-antigen ligase